MNYFKEILALEAIVFILFWINNEYLASLMTFISVPIFVAILIVSLIAEKIEKSNIGLGYFKLILGLALIPALLFVMFFAINGYQFDWMFKS